MLRLPNSWFLTEGVTNPEGKLVKGGKQRDEPSDLLLARASRSCVLLQCGGGIENNAAQGPKQKDHVLKNSWQGTNL